MARPNKENQCGCGCDDGVDRRSFMTTVGMAAGATAFTSLEATGDETLDKTLKKTPAKVRVVFLYPPSRQFADSPDGWWSWPGNEFDAENRQKEYTAALQNMQERLPIELTFSDRPVASPQDAQRLAKQIEADPQDGVLLVMFYNNSLRQADQLLAATEKATSRPSSISAWA